MVFRPQNEIRSSIDRLLVRTRRRRTFVGVLVSVIFDELNVTRRFDPSED